MRPHYDVKLVVGNVERAKSARDGSIPSCSFRQYAEIINTHILREKRGKNEKKYDAGREEAHQP